MIRRASIRSPRWSSGQDSTSRPSPALRETFTDMHLTYCMDDDIGAGSAAIAPVREAAGFRIYLVDGRDHCMRFTRDLESATGLVLAEILPDDAG